MQNGRTIIRHSEYVQPVLGTIGFSTLALQINPGLSQTFPWLSSVGNNYDKYRWKKLAFHLVPVSATSSSGRIALAFSFDALQPPPQTPQQLFSIVPNDEQAVWAETAISVPCKKDEFYLRNQAILTQGLYGTSIASLVNTDRKTYDMGALFVSTNYCSSSQTVAELYVSYEIELIDPTAQPGPQASEIVVYTSTLANLFPPNTTSLLGTSAVYDSAYTSTLTVTAPGTYLINYIQFGTVFTASTTISATVGTVSVTNVQAVINTAATTLMYYAVLTITVDSNLGICNLLFTPNATTVTSGKYWFTKLADGTTYS
jgi:hypothetical protein